MEAIKWVEIEIINGDGDGSGYGSGHGYGYGYGDGDGYGYGDGSGDGDGDGSGYGSGSGHGDGDGSGYGSGHGHGHGDGDGSGYDLKILNNQDVYLIDGVETIIKSIKGNIASGFIVNLDLTLTPCFIAKGENKFAHGNTAKEAVESLQDKLLKSTPIKKRIEMFNAKFKKGVKYPAIDFYNWHHILTGSCKLGRDSWCKDRGIDIDSDTFTVQEFIELTKNSYGSEIIISL